MARLDTRIPTYKPPKDLTLSWSTFRRGLNTHLKETELNDDELAQADNIVLVGKGVPTKRWGTELYFLSGATGSVRGLKGLYQSNGTVELLCLTDHGLLTKKSGASYSIVTGASWASGYDAQMAQLENRLYIVNGQREMVRYSSPTLFSFPTIGSPTNIFATGLSGVSGTVTRGYRVNHTTAVGETLASSTYTLPNQPQDPKNNPVKISFAKASAASGVIVTSQIFGRTEGDERFIGSVDGNATSFIDDGLSIASEFGYPPTANTTGGVVAKYIERFEDRLIFGGIVGDPSLIVISGRAPNQEKIDWTYGGGYIYIEPDAGDDVTGLKIFENRIIVFKERSIWQITLSYTTSGNYSVLVPTAQLITSSHGCIAPKSIRSVENDTFFLTRNGVYSLGYEPNVFNVLRTSEISARIRPFFESLTSDQKKNACAFYHKYHYGLSFPASNKTIVYDRERLAWTGPWNKDANIHEIFYDESDNELLISGKDDRPEVYTWDENFQDDEGSTINTILRTKKADFGDWVRFKNIKEVFAEFREVTGEVNVDILLQERSGQINTAKSFSINSNSANSGWGSFLWGDSLWGDSPENGGASDVNEIYRYTILNKAARTLQLSITTTHRNDDYEFLALSAMAQPMDFGFLPSTERV